MPDMPPKRCLILQHSATAGPGRVGDALDALGWETRIVRSFAGEAVPPTPPPDCAALVALGGAMSVHDEMEYPFLADEKRLLRHALAEDFPTLGICLGAQLLAHVAGARVYTGLKPERGWLPVAGTEKAAADPLFGPAFPPGFQPFQWHGDTFDLPPGAVHLAKSPLYTRQAFRLRENLYALQFHLEMCSALWDAWGLRDHPEFGTLDPSAPLAEIEPHAARFFRAFFRHAERRSP